MKNVKYNIVLPDVKNVSLGDLDLSVLERLGKVTMYPISNSSNLKERLKDADVILCNKMQLNKETLQSAEHLKYIGLFATGYNNVDIDYTNSRNITVCNAGSYSTDSVAQHTFALILNHYNKIAQYCNFVNKGGWKESETFSPFIYGMNELSGKSIGIIGLGNIGKKVAKIALAFEMNVIVNGRNMDKTLKIIENEFDFQIKYMDINDLVSNADIVTIHCPLNDESNKMINKDLLGKFKKNAYFVNTSRGGLVDEESLAYALNHELIGGAGIDVIDEEPMSDSCLLLGAKNITITPHVAWAPLETRERLLEIVVDNLESYLNGTPKNVVGGN